MEGFAGSGTHEFNDTPEQESWSAFPPQYADTGFKELQGGFGSFAANGTCIFRLSQQVVSSGGVQLVPSDIVVQLDGSGNIPSGVYLYLSTDLAPFSIYVVTVLDSRGKQISRQMFSFSETSSGVCDLNHLATSVPATGLHYLYSNVPGIFWAAIPWHKP